MARKSETENEEERTKYERRGRGKGRRASAQLMFTSRTFVESVRRAGVFRREKKNREV